MRFTDATEKLVSLSMSRNKSEDLKLGFFSVTFTVKSAGNEQSEMWQQH